MGKTKDFIVLFNIIKSFSYFQLFLMLLTRGAFSFHKAPLELRKQWYIAIKKASIKDFKFHDLGLTAANNLAMSGASLTDLSHILGHKTLQMVKRYSHLTTQHTATILEKMNEKQFANIENI